MESNKEMQKKRYPGFSAYTENDSDIFFGREIELQNIISNLDKNHFNLLLSESGAGKTSLLRAGVIPFLRRFRDFEIVYFDIPNCNKNNELTLLDLFYQSIDILCINESYIDKLTSKKYIWNSFKKLKSEHENPSIVLIFDSVEHIFQYPEEQQTDFFRNLSISITENIPSEIKNDIEAKLRVNTDLLTDEGRRHLETQNDVRVIFSSNTIAFKKFETHFPLFPEIENSIFNLQFFSIEQASKALANPAIYNLKINGLSVFISQEFEFSSETLERILIFLSKNGKRNIRPIFIQLFGLYIENLFIENGEIQLKNDSDLNSILLTFYEKILNEIPTESERNKARYFIEEFLILEHEQKKLSIYKGAAEQQFAVEGSILNYLKKRRLLLEFQQNTNDSYIELCDDLWISPIIESKNRRKNAELFALEKLKQAEVLKKKADFQLLKVRKIKTFTIIGFAAFVMALIGIFFINAARKKSELNEMTSRSNLFAYYAAKEIETDPTTAFRLAEEAYRINPKNANAAGSLITAYYSGESFYSILGNITKTTVSAQISPDRKSILTSNTNHRQKTYFLILNDLSGKEILRISHESPIISSDFTPDGKIITLTDAQGFVCFYNLKGLEFRRFKASDNVVWLCRFSPDMDKFLTSDAAGKLKLWRADSHLISELPQHDFDVYSADFSPNGEFIVTADEFTVKLYNTEGKFLRELPVPNKNSYYFPLIQSVRFSHNSEKIIVSINDRSGKNHIAWLTDLTGFNQMVFRGHTDWLNSAEFSDDDTRIISTSRDKTIKIWNVNGELIGTLKGHSANILDAEFDKASNTIFSVGDDKTIRNWHFGRLLNPMENIKTADFAIFSPDGLKILTVSANQVSLSDLTGKFSADFSVGNTTISAIAFSNSGNTIAVGSIDGNLSLHTLSGKEITVLKAHHKKINSICFSPDSIFLLSASDDSLAILWNIKKNIPEKVFRTEGKCTNAIFLSNKNSIVSSDNNGIISQWLISGKNENTFNIEDCGIRSLQTNLVATKLLICGDDNILRFADLKNHTVKTADYLKNNISSAAFSPDEKYLITGSNDGFLRLYNSNEREMIKLSNPGSIVNLSFSSDSKYIIAVYEKNGIKTAKIWVIDPLKILELTNTIKIFGNFQKISKENLDKYID